MPITLATDNTADSGRHNNTLTSTVFYALCKWAEANQEQCARKTRRELAEMASEALGKPITANNIGKVEEATGLRLCSRRPRGSLSNPSAKDRTGQVAHAVVAIYEEFGMAVPAYLMDIAQRRAVVTTP